MNATEKEGYQDLQEVSVSLVERENIANVLASPVIVHKTDIRLCKICLLIRVVESHCKPRGFIIPIVLLSFSSSLEVKAKTMALICNL